MISEQATTRNDTPPPRGPRLARPEWLCITLCLLFMAEVMRLIYNNSVDESSVSNRSFAHPALGLAGVLSSYLAWQHRSLPVFVRAFGWLVVTFAFYLGIGLVLILLNTFIGEALR